MSGTQGTLCWDCKKAIGKCRWSSSLKPIKGWVATPTKEGTPFSSYIVTYCPLFERDAVGFGLKRWKEENNDNNSQRCI